MRAGWSGTHNLRANMTQPIKTSRLAIASFCLALAAPLLYGLIRLLAALFPPAPGHVSPLTGPAGTAILLAAIASTLSLLIAFIVGFIATIQLLRRRGAEKGMVFALSGMLISGATGGYELLSSPREELRAQVPIVKGTPQGVFTLYKGGQPLVTGTFENGRKEGVWTLWDARGIKIREITYRNGLKEGTFGGWYSSFAPDESAKGKVLYEGRFSADRLDGEMSFYYSTGQVRCKCVFDHGEIKGARCWNQGGGELSQTEAVKEARSEAISVDGFLAFYDQQVENGIRQLLRSTPGPSGAR